VPKKIYGIRLHPEIYHAFKLLCDRSGYKRLNIAVERIMLKCVEDGVLSIPPVGSKEIELIRRAVLLKKTLELRRNLMEKVKRLVLSPID